MTQHAPRPVARIRTLAAVLAIAIAASVLAGCAPLKPGEPTDQEALDEGATALADLHVPMHSIPAHYYSQRVKWRTCEQFKCGEVSVPKNWNEPLGASISIALIEHPAPGDAAGTLVVDPGGPGESGIQFVGGDFSGVVDSALAAKYNIVGFDPRGVGYSAPIKCLSNKKLDAYIFAPTVGAVGSPKWIKNEQQRARTIAEGCDRSTGSFLADIDAVSVAHDLDVIRASLGESKLDYLGYSWGTYLGTVYAGLYPRRTGRMVLDGAFDPWSSVDRTGTAQVVGFEGDLNAYLTACLAGKSSATGKEPCPFAGNRAGARSQISTLLASADQDPLSGPHHTRLDASILVDGIVEALYSPKYWPYLTMMFTQLLQRQTTEAMVFINARYQLSATGAAETNFEVAFLASRCIEEGSNLDLDRDQAELTLLKQKAPIFGKYQGYDDIYCSGWKYGPAPTPVPIHAAGAAPILVIGTTGDPATPYGEAKDLAKQLYTAHLVTYHGEGHTGYNKGDACVDTTVDDYFLDGTVPTKDPDCH